MINSKLKLFNNPEIIFILLSLIFGPFYIFISPPFQPPDESLHFLKSYQLASFYNEFEITKSEIEEINSYLEMRWNTKHKINLNTVGFFKIPKTKDSVLINIQDIDFTVHRLELTNQISEVGINKIKLDSGLIPYIAYLPSALGIVIGKLFNLPFIVMLYLGRFTGFMVWLIVSFFALKIMPFMKNSMLLLLLMPMTIYIACSISYDPLTYSISFLWIATILNIYSDTDKKVAFKDILYLFALSFILSGCKRIYIILVLIFFIIPISRFFSRKMYFLAIGLIFIPLFATLFFPMILQTVNQDFVITPEYIIGNSFAEKSIQQLDYIRHSPIQFLKTAFSTVFVYKLPSILNSFIGKFGWYELSLPWIFPIYYLFLILTTGIAESETIPKFNLKNIVLFISIIFIEIIMILFVSFVLFTSWNSPRIGGGIIEGIQGRYFIPFSPLIILVISFSLSKILKIKMGKTLIKAIYYSIIFISIVSVIIIFNRYYFWG